MFAESRPAIRTWVDHDLSLVVFDGRTRKRRRTTAAAA
jgi:hypothetical protein